MRFFGYVDFFITVSVFTRMSAHARKSTPSIENQGLHRPKTKNCITVCEK